MSDELKQIDKALYIMGCIFEDRPWEMVNMLTLGYTAYKTLNEALLSAKESLEAQQRRLDRLDEIEAIVKDPNYVRSAG